MTVKEEVEIKKRSIIVDTEDEDEILVAHEDVHSDEENLSKKSKEEDPNSGIIFYLLDNHMWIFAIWLIPISIFYDIFWWCQARWTYWMCKSNRHLIHDEKVIFFLNIEKENSQNL